MKTRIIMWGFSCINYYFTSTITNLTNDSELYYINPHHTQSMVFLYDSKSVSCMITKCFVPFPTLETERLILRFVEDTDVEHLYEILSDAENAKLDYFHPLTSIEQAQKFIDRFKKEIEANEEITWRIVLKESNTFIGTCCFGNFDDGASRVEIGYNFARAHWGNGYATEALSAIIDYGFTSMNLNRIESTITPGNDASVEVLSKLNFVHEGIVRERDLIKGKLEDGIMMSILKRDYPSK